MNKSQAISIERRIFSGTPEEHKRIEFTRAKEDLGIALIKYLETQKSPIIVELEDKIEKHHQHSSYDFFDVDVIRLIAWVTPVQYRNVTIESPVFLNYKAPPKKTLWNRIKRILNK